MASSTTGSVSVSDDYDFRAIETSSSAQTSTASPFKHQHRSTSTTTGTNFDSNMTPDFPESFAFYSGPAVDEIDHISKFRKSLHLSPSFNSIASKTATTQHEEPTHNIGMVISPSMRALSDILTSKVALNKSSTALQNTTIDEVDEDGLTDMETILPNSIATQQPTSLMDDIFVPKHTSTDTLTNNNGDLIDLSSPVAPTFSKSIATVVTTFTNSNDPSFNDIYESYSPSKDDYADEFSNNQFSQPQLSNSLSKLTINTSDDEDTQNQSNEFSFQPSRQNTMQSKEPQRFVQTTQKRNSFEIVKEQNDKSPFINDYLNSIKLTNSSQFDNSNIFSYTPPTTSTSALGISTQIQPQILSPPPIEYETPKVEQISTFNDLTPTNNVLNSPIRNTSPTFENYKHSVSESPKKSVIQLSKPTEQKTTQVQAQPPKPKSKLTFKSFFSSNSENKDKNKVKSPLLSPRPKSFGFTKDIGDEPKTRKEKGKSLLSGWKRKSLFTKDSEKKSNVVNKHSKSQSTASLPVLSSPKQHTFPASPHRHTKSTTDLFDKGLPNLPPPHAIQKDESLLQTYGFNSPIVNASPIFSTSPEQQFKETLPFSRNPTVKRTDSEKSIENMSSPKNLVAAQSATIDQVTPSIVNTSSHYDTSKDTSNIANMYDADLSFFQQPQLPDAVTPKIDQQTPTLSVVDSFMLSPNRYHVSDDMFPKKLGVTEIESIVSLERSRSIKSQVSHGIHKKNSILRMVHQQEEHDGEEVREMKLPDGSVIVRSPLVDQASFTSRPSRRSSILKRPGLQSQSPTQIRSSMSTNSVAVSKTSRLSKVSGFDDDEDFNDLLDLINFGDNDDQFTTDMEFDIDTAMQVTISPMQKLQRDASVPDFLGVEMSYTTMNFDDDISVSGDNVVNGNVLSGLRNERFVSDDEDEEEEEEDTELPPTPPPHTAYDESTEVSNVGAEYYYDDDQIEYQYVDDENEEYFDDEDEEDHEPELQLNQSFQYGNTDPSVNNRYNGYENQYYNEQNNQQLNQGINQRYSQQYVQPDEDNYDHYEQFDQYVPYEQYDQHDQYTQQQDQYEQYDSPHQNSQQNYNFGYQGEYEGEDNYEQSQPQNNFKGLKGPTFKPAVNVQLQPETQSAILGSLVNQKPVSAIVQSDSDLSISYAAQAYEYENYNNEYQQYPSPTPSRSPSPSRYSLNNPFTDYTQRYDDDIPDSVAPTFNSNRKSVEPINKFATLRPAHVASASLPTPKESKPKTLKKKNRTSVSFGSMFESLLLHKDDPAPSRGVKFSSRILLYDTYGEDEYDRKPDSATCNSLTPQIAMEIKNELNALKSEMPVHEDSVCYTHFF